MDVPQPGGLELAPFQGVRYTAACAPDPAAVTAPPYDLIDAAEAEHLRSSHPHNVVRLIRPRDRADGDRYGAAKETLGRWLAEGVLAADDQPALYVYEERSAAGTQRGLLGGVRLAAPETGVILPHEDTTPGPVEDRLRLLRATEANLEPIFLLYDGGGAASAIVDDVAEHRAPVCVKTTSQEVTYRLWALTDSDEHARISGDLRQRTALIADGHHRYATYLRYQAEQYAAGHGPGPWDFGLAMLVDSTTHPPRLGSVHRVVSKLPPDEAVRHAQKAFRVTFLGSDEAGAQRSLADAARKGPAFLVSGNGTFHLLSDVDHGLLDRVLPAPRSARWRQLSTAVLHHFLIPVVWGLEDDENSVLTVHNDSMTACDLAEQTGGTAVLLAPLQVADVLAVAREGEPVPRKSTSFGPKPRTGLVLRLLHTV